MTEKKKKDQDEGVPMRGEPAYIRQHTTMPESWTKTHSPDYDYTKAPVYPDQRNEDVTCGVTGCQVAPNTIHDHTIRPISRRGL